MVDFEEKKMNTFDFEEKKIIFVFLIKLDIYYVFKKIYIFC